MTKELEKALLELIRAANAALKRHTQNTAELCQLEDAVRVLVDVYNREVANEAPAA